MSYVDVSNTIFSKTPLNNGIEEFSPLFKGAYTNIVNHEKCHAAIGPMGCEKRVFL